LHAALHEPAQEPHGDRRSPRPPPHAGPSDDDLALKILVSNGDAGAIIGKGGSNISAIKASTGTSVKMSQTGDFFPGTQERVLLLTGTLPGVTEALRQVLAKTGLPAPGSEPTMEAVEVKLRMPVPNSAAGGIIGKAGATIKQISESSGARVQLSQKDEMHPELNER